MAWKKRMCYVVTAFYREEEELPDQPEEETYLDYQSAEQARQRFEADSDIEAVYLEEEEREVWVNELDELIERAGMIVENEKLTVDQKDLLLADMMTNMERKYRIPLLKNSEWEAKHKDVIDTYRKISDMRSI